MLSLSSITSSYSGPVCCSGLEDDTACRGREDDLEVWEWCLLIQWYNRAPARTPAVKNTTAVPENAIPTAAPVVRGSITSRSAWGDKYAGF